MSIKELSTKKSVKFKINRYRIFCNWFTQKMHRKANKETQNHWNMDKFVSILCEKLMKCVTYQICIPLYTYSTKGKESSKNKSNKRIIHFLRLIFNNFYFIPFYFPVNFNAHTYFKIHKLFIIQNRQQFSFI